MNKILKNTRIGYVLKVFPRLSETFVLNEILELEQQNIEVEVFSLKPSMEARYHARLADLKAEIHHLSLPGSTSRTWNDTRVRFESIELDPDCVGAAFVATLRSTELKYLFQAMQLVSEIKMRGIEHVHAHFASSATWVCLLAHLLSGVSFSFTAHAKDIYHENADHVLLEEAIRRASFVITVTDHNLVRLNRYLSEPTTKIHRIYNGIRLEDYHPYPRLLDQSPLILGVGRLVEKKGFAHLIDACRELKHRGLRFRCVILGDGVERERLEDQVRALGLEGTVMLKGAQSHNVVTEYMARSNVVVLPCIVAQDGNRDALPTVLLEAMALGRPVVSTDLPGVTEIIDHENTGLLVPQGESEDLAAALEKVITDPHLSATMGEAGRTRAAELFDLRRNVAEISRLFRQTTQAEADPIAEGAGRV